MLGPAGMGLVGLYETAASLVGTICRMGIGSSGVRTVAEAAGAGDEAKVSSTIITLRRVSLVSGTVGMIVLLGLSFPLGRLTFGDSQHTWGMALMSLTLLFGGISAGQTALLQGMRKIRELASSQVLGSVFGAIASISLIYFLKEDGVAPYLVTVSAFGILTSWWYARRIRVKKVFLSFWDTLHESKALLGMGMAFMVSALLAAGVAYGSRVLILWELGKDAVGLYQATWTLSSLYVSLVLNAMAMDFYPRLTAVANVNAEVNRLVNEQTEMGLLISIPGVLATITLAPWVLTIFYSGEFTAAAEIIRWQIIGIALRVVSWPLGFVQLAKGKGKVFVLTELAASALHIILLIVCIRLYGLDGVGIAFALLYVCYTVGMFFTCRWLSGFKWSRPAKKILVLSCAIVALTFIAVRYLPQMLGVACGMLLTLVAAYACLQSLQKLLDVNFMTLLRTKIAHR
jgi:PST family polysaccharide transporter